MNVGTGTDLSLWSNDELYRALKECGFNPGPVTETTRAVYVKKIQRTDKETVTYKTKDSKVIDSISPYGGAINTNVDSSSSDSQDVQLQTTGTTDLQKVGGGAEISAGRGKRVYY